MDNKDKVQSVAVESAGTLRLLADFTLPSGLSELKKGLRHCDEFVQTVEAMEPEFHKLKLCARILKLRKQMSVTVGHNRRANMQELEISLLQRLEIMDH